MSTHEEIADASGQDALVEQTDNSGEDGETDTPQGPFDVENYDDDDDEGEPDV